MKNISCTIFRNRDATDVKKIADQENSPHYQASVVKNGIYREVTGCLSMQTENLYNSFI